MSCIEWSEKLSLGIDSIDRQHKVLIKCINDLDEAMSKDESFKTHLVSSVITKLVNYTKVHFKYEEIILFQHISFPEADDHKVAHELLFKGVEAFMKRLQTENIDTIHPELMEFLNKWLTNHILKEDMKYAIYIRENGIDVK